MLEEIAKVAAQTAIEHLEKETQKQKKVKRDRRLRNTRLLLKHYRAFKEHVADVHEELEEIDDLELSEELESDELAIEMIRKSKKRTLAIIHFIDQMLFIYRINCERSPNLIHLRQYKTIYDLYIADEETTVEAIAEKNDIDTRTVYRDIKEGIHALSCLIFGVDGIRMIE